MTKPVEYTVSINRGFGGLDILDAFLNFHYDDRAQLKVGRFMTPFNYEQFAIQNMWLFAPERSLFTSNLGLNRQLGVQLWGIALRASGSITPSASSTARGTRTRTSTRPRT